MFFSLRHLARFDWLLLGAIFFLLGMGLLALYSFSETITGNGYFLRQLLYAAIGLLALFFLANFDYRIIARYSTPLYFAMLFLLVIVLFFGKSVHGTIGWLSFGIFQVQPVEFAKPVLIIFLASFISQKRSELGEWTRLIASLFLSAVMIFLVLRQPDLGSSLVLAFIWFSMILVSGIRFKHFFVLALLGIALVGGSWFLLADYQKARIHTFINPALDPRGSGYNVIQAMVAVGSGGLSGKGIGHGSQSELNFLPARHTDFIFSVLAEELGLTGGILIILAYGFLLYRIKRTSALAADNVGYLIATGILAMLFVQIAVNLGMNMGLLPVTGLPAPLLSYGGSSLLSVFISLGILLSIYRFRKGRDDTLVSLERPLLDLSV